MQKAFLAAVLWAAGAATAWGIGRGRERGALELQGSLLGATRGHNWTKLGRSIKIYVYDLPSNVSFQVAEADRNRNYYFEVAVPMLLRASALHRAFRPEEADFFYVPAELNSHWYFCKTKFCESPPWDADKKLVAFLRSVGPYWDTHQDRHVVPSLACPVLPGNPSVMRPSYTQLWEGRAIQLCLWADRQTIDKRRSLHVGYYVPDMAASEPLPPDARDRDILAVYVGAPINHHRIKVASWMQRSCRDCRAFVVQEHGNASTDLLRDYHATLRRARFAIEPPGDTMERMSRDASILAGAVPVVFDNPQGMRLKRQFLPWQPVLDWPNFSVSFALTELEVGEITNFVPRLEKLLRGMVQSGEADRLYQGLVAAQSKLRWSEDGVVSTLASLLARKRYLATLERKPEPQSAK